MSEKVIVFDRVHTIITNRDLVKFAGVRLISRGEIWYNIPRFPGGL